MATAPTDEPLPATDDPPPADDPADAPAAAGDEPSGRPARRKKKRRRAPADEAAASDGDRSADDADDGARPNDGADEGASGEAPAALPGEPWRPAFARLYPRHPELDRLVERFVAGDNAAVFEGAPQLASRTDDPAVARAARDLRQRIEPDRLSLIMLAMMGGLLLFLVVWFYSHRHGH